MPHRSLLGGVQIDQSYEWVRSGRLHRWRLCKASDVYGPPSHRFFRGMGPGYLPLALVGRDRDGTWYAQRYLPHNRREAGSGGFGSLEEARKIIEVLLKMDGRL